MIGAGGVFKSWLVICTKQNQANFIMGNPMQITESQDICIDS